MKCTNRELGKFALLSGGEPDEQLPESVKEHLASCTYCAEQRKRYFDWRNLLSAKSKPHMSMDVLLAYEQMTLTPAQQDRAKEHLATCHQCAETVARFGAAFDSLEKDEAGPSDNIPSWTVERERSFVARMKTELAARGQLAQERPWPVLEKANQPLVHSRRFLRYAFALALGFAAVILMASVARYFYLKSERGRLGVNENLSTQGSQSSPSQVARQSAENANLTVRHPIQHLTPPKKLPSPESPPSADIQDVALVIDPTRGPSPRTEISLSQRFVRFSVSIKGPATTRSFQLEMIDEEIGKTIEPIKRVKARVSPHDREVTLLIPTKDMIHALYILRLTGLTKSGETAEIFTVYLKVTN
jgi:hypothetical protein